MNKERHYTNKERTNLNYFAQPFTVKFEVHRYSIFDISIFFFLFIMLFNFAFRALLQRHTCHTCTYSKQQHSICKENRIMVRHYLLRKDIIVRSYVHVFLLSFSYILKYWFKISNENKTMYI